jgi:hypothetical protein
MAGLPRQWPRECRARAVADWNRRLFASGRAAAAPPGGRGPPGTDLPEAPNEGSDDARGTQRDAPPAAFEADFVLGLPATDGSSPL